MWSVSLFVCVLGFWDGSGCVCPLRIRASESGEENEDKDRWEERGEEKQKGNNGDEGTSRI